MVLMISQIRYMLQHGLFLLVRFSRHPPQCPTKAIVKWLCEPPVPPKPHVPASLVSLASEG